MKERRCKSQRGLVAVLGPKTAATISLAARAQTARVRVWRAGATHGGFTSSQCGLGRIKIPLFTCCPVPDVNSALDVCTTPDFATKFNTTVFHHHTPDVRRLSHLSRTMLCFWAESRAAQAEPLRALAMTTTCIALHPLQLFASAPASR